MPVRAARPVGLDLLQLQAAELEQREPPHRRTAADELGDELVGGLGEHLLGRVVLLEHPAGAEHGDAVAELDRLGQVVGDEADGLRDLLLDAEELVLQPVAGDRVDGPERLVHQHHRRVGRQATGHTDPLLLSPGELARVPAAEVARLQAHQVQQLVHPRVDPRAFPAEDLGHDRDVVGDREVREQPDLLDDVPDPAPQLVAVDLGDVLPVEQDPPRGRLDQAVHHLQGGGLAAPRGADEHHDRAVGHVEAEILDRGLVLARVGLADLIESDHRPDVLRHGSPSGWSDARWRGRRARRPRRRPGSRASRPAPG